MLKSLPLQFPEPEEFTFDELKAHWRDESHRVEREILAGRLRPCLELKELLRIPRWDYLDPISMAPTEALTWGELLDGDSPEASQLQEGPDWWRNPAEVASPGVLYLQLPNKKRPVDCIFTVGSPRRDPHVPDVPNGETKSRSEWYLLPKQVTMADLKERGFFSKEEVQRCEDRYRTAPLTANLLIPEEKATLLNIIAGLLMLTRELEDEPERNGELPPNWEKIDAGIAAAVVKDLRTYPGMTLRTVKGKFREANYEEERSANPLMPKEKATLLNIIAGLLTLIRKLRNEPVRDNKARGKKLGLDEIDVGIAAEVAAHLGVTRDAIEERFSEANGNVE